MRPVLAHAYRANNRAPGLDTPINKLDIISVNIQGRYKLGYKRAESLLLSFRMKSLAGIILIFLTLSSAIANNVYEEDTVCSASGRQHRSYEGKIVDIKKSRELGARLLTGSSVSSYSDCMESCCYDDTCDMALFRNQDTYNTDGSPKHNCYLIQCKEKEYCILAHHSHFTATYFGKSKEEEWDLVYMY